MGVRLLEAGERWGGRLTGITTTTGQQLDLGGQWVGASHHRLQALLERFGLQRYPTYFDGEGVFWWQGQNHRGPVEHDFRASLLFFQPHQLGLPRAEVEETLALQRAFQAITDQVPAPAPWQAPDAETLDRTSIAAWLEQHDAGELARFPFRWFTRVGGLGGFEPHESSLLHLAWSQAAAPQHETPEAWLVKGGAFQVADHLARQLVDDLQLRAAVAAIAQDRSEVRVLHGDGTWLAAAAAVVAIPPPLRLGIRFEPPLPSTWTGLLQRSPMGSMVKVLAIYPQPFWREQGLNGLGFGMLPTLEATVDCSPPDGPGLLTGFIAGARAVAWQQLDERARRQAVLHDLQTWWGPQAVTPQELICHNWNQQSWSGGAFTSFVSPGAWTTYGSVWQRPHGRVFWAGTEASSVWPGYCEGAVHAGLAAAVQVQRLLGGDIS
jgi:monoamine oxidase